MSRSFDRGNISEYIDISPRFYFLNTPFNPIDNKAALNLIGRADPQARFRYVVTPNADHVVRLNRESDLRPLYDASWLALCDSKPISLYARARSRVMTHITGSDLTVSLFSECIRQGDRVALIVANAKIGEDVRLRYPKVEFSIHVPPMNLMASPTALEDCVEFVAVQKARFAFIAVGSPQSEKIAYLISMHPDATGIGLCIGASLEFLVGAKKRAPVWMRKLSLEWLHRMLSDPKRLWRRYTFGAIPLITLFFQEMRRPKAGGTA